MLDRADRELLANLADRLAYVCATVLAAALPTAERGGRTGVHGGGLISGTGGPPPGPRGEPVTPFGPGGPQPGPRGEPATPTGPGGRGEVLIVDERRGTAVPGSARVVVARGGSTAPTAEHDGDLGPAREHPAGASPAATEWASRPDAAVADAAPPRPFVRPAAETAPATWQPETDADRASPLDHEVDIQIRDERIEEGPAAWIRSIGRELERFALDGRPFAVLLIELMDAERLNGSEPADEVLRLAGLVQRTLESELWSLSERAGASLTREAPGRFWLLVPGIEALRVAALAEQVEHAVRRSVSHRGQPVEIAVGTAVCPADGVQAAALAAHADVALYTARSAGSARRWRRRLGRSPGELRAGPASACSRCCRRRASRSARFR